MRLAQWGRIIDFRASASCEADALFPIGANSVSFKTATKCCDNCGSANPERAQFCSRCGRRWGDPLLRSTTTLSSLLAAWRQLNYRTTRKDVRRILGEPKRIEPPVAESADRTERWIYEYETVGERHERIRGEVQIDVTASCVCSWKEPDWDQLPAG